MATATLLSWEEFERLPDDPGKRELLNGELLELPPAKYRHNNAAHWILFQLLAALEQAHARGEAAGLGLARTELGYRLGRRSWLQPDVSVTHAGQAVGDYIEGSPAIAIEVVSPPDTPRTLAAKTALYFEFGAQEVWHVYLDDPRIEVFTPGAGAPAICRDTLTTPLLPGFVLNLAELLRA